MNQTTNDLDDMIRALASHGAMFDGGSEASRRDIAEDWADHDFTAAQADRWMDAGYWDAATAAEARDMGYTPDTCLAYPADSASDWSGMEPIYAACNNDIALAKLVVA